VNSYPLINYLAEKLGYPEIAAMIRAKMDVTNH
jgi:hypothetical protein